MEKLQPLLVHKYWIVFGLALILPTVGWWIDTAGVDAATKAAMDIADNAFKDVPPPNSPNASWPTDLQKTVNVPLERDYKKYNRYLWETQGKARLWPASMNAYMQGIPFEGEIDPPIRRKYRKEYVKELDAAWKVVDPLTDEWPKGKVVFHLSDFTPQVDPEGDWPDGPPDSQEMWEVQQDIWLLTALLSAIEKVNHEFGNHVQAPINTILAIELRGGSSASRKSSSTERGAATGGSEQMAEAENMYSRREIGGRSGRFGQAAGGNARSGANIDIDLTKLFGPDNLARTTKQSGDTGDIAAEAERGMRLSANMRGGNGGRQGRRRYVDDEKGAPFKTRAFYLKVIMDHTRLHDLMIQLSNLEWPVQIVLVQQQILNPDNLRVVSGGTRRRGDPAMPTGMMLRQGGARRSFAPARVMVRGGNSRPPRDPMQTNYQAADGNRNGGIAGMIQAASLKPNLATVTIAGKLTLFQPPPQEDGALAAAGNVENEKQATPETADDADTKATDSPETTQNAADTPTEDPAATQSPASTPQPDSKATQSKGTDNPPSDGTPDNQSPAETNSSKPPATGTNETDNSTSSRKDDRPE